MPLPSPRPSASSFRAGPQRSKSPALLKDSKDEARFVLKAKKGQRLEVRGEGRGSLRIFVDFPNGEGDGAPGGVEIDSLPADGDYIIRVHESSMGEAWKGSFTLKITVK